MHRPKAILFIFGDGGHKEQTKRLINLLNIQEEFPEIKFISLSEYNQVIKKKFHRSYFAPELRPKFKVHFMPFIMLKNSQKQLCAIIKILLKYKVIVSISTGPGISIIPTYFMKLFNIPNIYVETWSRFETKSLAGKLIYPISNLFFIQNKDLQVVYPKAQYSGRL